MQHENHAIMYVVATHAQKAVQVAHLFSVSNFKRPVPLWRTAAAISDTSVPVLASRVDIEIGIEDEEDDWDDGDEPGPSTSGRGNESPQTESRHPSLSLTASLDPVAVEECALLVILYNMERENGKRIADRVLGLFDRHPDLATRCETRLPGLTLRLRRNPEGARDALRSLEVLLDILRIANPSEAVVVKEEVEAMTSLYASNVGSRDKETLRGLPETPMWASAMFRATTALIQSTDIEEMDENRQGAREGEGAPRAVLRLRCNGKTAGQGFPMTVSARIEVEKTDHIQSVLRDRLQDGYAGKSLADIATSVWSALRLSRRADDDYANSMTTTRTPFTGTLHLGDDEDTSVQLSSVHDLDAVVLALAYLTRDGTDGRAWRRGSTRAVRDTWVPADARIRFSRSQGTPSESTYRVMVSDKSGAEGAKETLMDSSTVVGLVDLLDVLRAIDPHLFSIV